jgi:hypothetical protein
MYWMQWMILRKTGNFSASTTGPGFWMYWMAAAHNYYWAEITSVLSII